MKKIFFVPWILVFVSAVCFTGGVSASSGTSDSAAPVPARGKTLVGKVDEVVVREDAKGKYRQMTIRDDAGRQTSFLIAPDATVTGKDGNPTSLSWVKGHRVSVECVTVSDGFTQIIKSVREL